MSVQDAEYTREYQFFVLKIGLPISILLFMILLKGF